MYHVPLGDDWDPESINVSLRSRNIDSRVVGNEVRVAVLKSRPRNVVAKLFRWLFAGRPYCVTIQFRPERFLRNIHLDYDPMKSVPLSFLDEITDAMHERGYVVGSERRIANRYDHGSDELRQLLDELDRIQLEQEQLIEKEDFAGAALLRDEKNILRERMDAILFAWSETRPKTGTATN